MKVTAVIPALDEEQTIGAVVAVARGHARVDEVIVVNDGSTDGTSRIAKRAGARVIDLPENHGKAAAMRAGAQATDAEWLLFLDGDLIGLTHDHISDLLEPILKGEADMSVGLFRNGRMATDLAQVLAPYLSGLRVLRRETMLALSEDEAEVCRFGIEVALTVDAKKRGARVVEVPLEEITHRMKEEKLGLVKGFAARMKMYREIISYVIKQGLDL